MAYAAPDNVFIDDITLPAVDGFSLAGTLFLARGRKTHAVLINSAAGVSREAYRGFAAYLASRGSAVLTYDYRGIGTSRPTAPAGRDRRPSLKGFEATMADWAARDVTAAVAWMRGRYKDLPLAYVGHAFGGHALGLIPNNTDIARALLINTQTGSWKNIKGTERYRVMAAAKLLGVPFSKILGYLPGWLASGQDLPKGAFEQWMRWTANPNYFFEDASLPALGNFANYTGALRALIFTDDIWSTEATLELITKEFSATRPQVISLSPNDLGVRKIGHMGFFEPEMRDPLWRGMAEWLEAEAPAQATYSTAVRA